MRKRNDERGRRNNGKYDYHCVIFNYQTITLTFGLLSRFSCLSLPSTFYFLPSAPLHLPPSITFRHTPLPLFHSIFNSPLSPHLSTWCSSSLVYGCGRGSMSQMELVPSHSRNPSPFAPFLVSEISHFECLLIYISGIL